MEFYKKLILCVLICLGGGWLSGLQTEQGIVEWYAHLKLPAGTPPNAVFPIVWTFLYILMGISLALFWSSDSSGKRAAGICFFLQLLLNFSWSWIFFGLRAPGIALIDLLLLSGVLLATIITFKKHTPLGAMLLIPYWIWVTYAMYLNLSIWILNG